MRTQLILATAALALISASPALAAGETWKVGNDSFHIYFDDLDLKTMSGRATALARVEKAADRICANAGVRAEVAACRANVVQSVNGSAASALKMAVAERSLKATVVMAQGR